jgi:quercetin dioxygenase-like cupin family protein
MEVIRADPVRRQSRQPGETREYYDSDHFRIVVTELAPGDTQMEHRHEVLYDITWVIEGTVVVTQRDVSGAIERATLGPGDMAVLEPGPLHNMANLSDARARTLTLKFVRPDGLTREAFRQLCDADWIPSGRQ